MRIWAFVALGRTMEVIVTRESTDSGETATAREIVRRCAGVVRTRSEPKRSVTAREPDGSETTDETPSLRGSAVGVTWDVTEVAKALVGRPASVAANTVRPATQVRRTTVITATLFAFRRLPSTPRWIPAGVPPKRWVLDHAGPHSLA